MSFIRALSNPEAMYAYGSIEGGVYISSNGLLDRRGNHHELHMPRGDFFGLFRKWVREHYPEEVKFRGASLVEIPSRATTKQILRGKGLVPSNAYQWRLSHVTWGKKSIVAYKVTWFYVAHNVVSRK